MRSVLKSAQLVADAIVWLILLLATTFSVVTVDAGLVGVLGLTAASIRSEEYYVGRVSRHVAVKGRIRMPCW